MKYSPPRTRTALEGTPAQIFAQGDLLQNLGLSAPTVTLLMAELIKAQAIPATETIYTLEQATRSLLALLATP